MSPIVNLAHTSATLVPAKRKLARLGLFALLPTLCAALFATAAHAACGSVGGVGSQGSVHLPFTAIQGPYSPPRPGISPIVGLWHVVYTNGVNQSTFNDTFDTWHDDGTEFESAFLPPAAGNVCVGVWKQTAPRTVTLHHVGWLFDPYNLVAPAANTFTLDEVVTVGTDGTTYTGTFTFKIWNLDGSPTPTQVTGTIAATRITVS